MRQGDLVDYQCPVCGKIIKDAIPLFVDHTEGHILEIIKKNHPQWVSENGVFPPCLAYDRQQLRSTGEITK